MNRQGEYVPVKPIKNAILVNSGELLEKWTGGLIKATVGILIFQNRQSSFSDTEFERRPTLSCGKKSAIR